ncbi:hypothetical protein [Microbacterium sp. 77mftsu3.1]|uniref:hypothetical protein n=1 Tax=Microbacterium sp. 77mftsu3.1 TaxID=1761802 RepID=UPI000380793E|nr:hypothetical protein [Microbacterium sp. 77mftsu3.1]SDH55632.1 hypothetical protein SAMN04488590_3567 [Microbacterium sp. 77mftsu3.1]
MTTPIAPSFPNSCFTQDLLAKAWETNSAERQAEVDSYRAQGLLTEDETHFALRDYRYSKSGIKSLNSEVWVPIAEIPLTPEEAWADLSRVILAIEDAEDDGEDPRGLLEVAQLLAAYAMTFAIAPTPEGATANQLPDDLVVALVTHRALTQARSDVDDARKALATRGVSISKVRKLEEVEEAAAKAHLDAALYALDAATGFNAGSVDAQAPELADLMRAVAADMALV